jgi:GxxExxY protein
VTELLHKDLTHEIIGVYYTVYNKLSQTYPEFIYERAMMALLKQGGLCCRRQVECEVLYKERLVGLQRLDLLVADEVIVELKVADCIAPLHLAQLLSYLKVFSREVGLLFRFGGPEPDFARRVLSSRDWSETVASSSMKLTDRPGLLYPELTREIMGGALEVFKWLGPGLNPRLYANACYHESKLRGLPVKARREIRVFMDGLDLGEIKLRHL